MNTKSYTSIKLYLSSSDKAKIESAARTRGLSTSEYCKNRILQSGITINIKTDDLSAFAQQVSQINDSINSISSISNKSKSTDYEDIEELLTELNRNCRMLLKNRYKKRKDITTDLKEYLEDYLDNQ